MNIDLIDLIDSKRVRRSGNWKTDVLSRYEGGDPIVGQTSGDFLQFAVMGDVMFLHAMKGPEMGEINVYVDGVLEDTISLLDGGASENYETAIKIAGTFNSNLHIVKIEVVTPDVYLDSFYAYQSINITAGISRDSYYDFRTEGYSDWNNINAGGGVLNLSDLSGDVWLQMRSGLAGGFSGMFEGASSYLTRKIRNGRNTTVDFRFRTNSLPTPADDYYFLMGILANWPYSSLTNGIYLFMDSSSPNFIGKCTAGGLTTAVDLGYPITANTPYWGRIFVHNDGYVQFGIGTKYSNIEFLGTPITTNIPSDTAAYTLGILLEKDGAGTNRNGYLSDCIVVEKYINER